MIMWGVSTVPGRLPESIAFVTERVAPDALIFRSDTAEARTNGTLSSMGQPSARPSASSTGN
jgi:hypothetical protein